MWSNAGIIGTAFTSECAHVEPSLDLGAKFVLVGTAPVMVVGSRPNGADSEQSKGEKPEGTSWPQRIHTIQQSPQRSSHQRPAQTSLLKRKANKEVQSHADQSFKNIPLL